MSQRTKFLKVDDCPEVCLRDLDIAAKRYKLSRRAAFLGVYRAVDLRRAVVAGQMIETPGGSASFGIHVEPDVHSNYKRVAQSLGVKMSQVGRLLMISQHHRFVEILRNREVNS